MKKPTEEIKEMLLKEISKTESMINKLKIRAKPITAEGSVGRVSRMNAINNDTVVSTLLYNAEVKLISLNKVLSQIGSDKFGQCLKCSKPIALGRILARPESLLCVKCAR